MAIDVTTWSSNDARVSIAQEAAFGTAITNAGFHLAEFDEVSVDWGLTQSIPSLRAARMASDSDVYVSQTGGTRTITISNITFRRQDLPEFLYAVLQNVTEGATTPFQKTFEQWSSAPDFGSDAGYFCTVGIYMPEGAGKGFTFKSCVCTQLDLKADLIGGDGRLTGTATFISGFAADPSATIAGTSISSQAYFDFNAMSTKTLGGNDIVVYGFDISIKNNAVRVGNDSSGDAENYSFGIPEVEITGTLKTKHDANTGDIADDLVAGTPREIILSVGTDDTTGHCQIDLDNVVFTDHGMDAKQQQGFAVELPFKTVLVSTDYPTITVADAYDQSW